MSDSKKSTNKVRKPFLWRRKQEPTSDVAVFGEGYEPAQSERSWRRPGLLKSAAVVLAALMILPMRAHGQFGIDLAAILAALFLMSISATIELLQGWNSGGEYATTDMLTSLWNYIAGQIMPAAAGLACVGAVINYVRHRPWVRLIFAAIAFLSLSGLLALFKAMAA